MISKFIFNGQQEKEVNGQKIITQLPPKIVLQTNGAFISVNISHPQKVIAELVKQGKQSPVFSCRALLDTGASSCVITPKVANALNLVQTGFQKVASVHSSEDRPVYFGVLIFPWGRAKEVPLVCCDLQGFDCLIGRDVLQHWHITYDGTNGELTICD